MKRVMIFAAVPTVLSVVMLTAACSNKQSGSPAPAATTTGAPEITFRSNPDPAKMGENTFEVMVMQGGAPVDGATVSTEFVMPAMPAMKMAEMRTKTDLAPVGNGTYRGKGQVMMAGTWDVTVMAMKDGKEIATKKLAVTAQ